MSVVDLDREEARGARDFDLYAFSADVVDEPRPSEYVIPERLLRQAAEIANGIEWTPPPGVRCD